MGLPPLGNHNSQATVSSSPHRARNLTDFSLEILTQSCSPTSDFLHSVPGWFGTLLCTLLSVCISLFPIVLISWRQLPASSNFIGLCGPSTTQFHS